MKYYFMTYEENICEFSHLGHTVQMAADDVSTDDVVSDYFGDFYGETTTRQDSGWYDETECPQRYVKLLSIREISKKDYDVLKRYL